MRKSKFQKGFTLIEMLVVIAIIAVLAAVLIPTASTALKKANAAVDAANLRSVLGLANTLLLENSEDAAATMAGINSIESKTFPGAVAYMAYVNPGFMMPYYVVGDNYYSLTYFTDIADHGLSSESTVQPTGYTWYRVGGTT